MANMLMINAATKTKAPIRVKSLKPLLWGFAAVFLLCFEMFGLCFFFFLALNFFSFSCL